MRLLLVEDDAAIARFVRKGLEAERYEVHVAADGELAIAMATTESYGVILLDLGLPRASGIQVCHQLRAGGVHTPILVLTARDSVDDKVRLLTAGADDYVTKPFAFEELLARIQALLRRPSRMEVERRLQVADLVLDPETRDVRRGETLIDLTPREFSLLEYLMRRPGRVATRTLLEECVWGLSHDPSTNIIDVYIRRLRQKIDADGRPPLIHTVRGIGYVLKTDASLAGAAI
jgi:DNA-binding response OmpR family regulator